MKAFGWLTAVVLAVIAVGAPLVGGLPGTASAQRIERSVEKAEGGYFVTAGSPSPTVSYVATTPRKTFDYLSSVRWSNGFYSWRDCHCALSASMAIGEFGTVSAELGLIPAEQGPVALVELSADRFYWDSRSFMASGGPVCVAKHCHRPAPPVYEASVAFLVVNLTDGRTTGGMIATPDGGGPIFDLRPLGPVTSWTGPSDFAAGVTGPASVLLVFGRPHATRQ